MCKQQQGHRAIDNSFGSLSHNENLIELFKEGI